MANLTDIQDRLTPSVPIELTFSSQTIAQGRKVTTLYGHMAASPGSGTPFQVYTVVNVGDPVAAQNEVNALAGAGSQIGKMAYAFVNANAAAGGTNFPAFRVVLMPYGELHFGPNQEAILNTKFLRSDMLVSCYPAGDSTNRATLLSLCSLMSGVDRDLQGQFGSFMTLGSVDPLATQTAYNINSRFALVASLPDSNTALVPVLGSVTTASNIVTAVSQASLSPTGTTSASSTVITAVSSTAGIYPGASISGTNIPVGAVVQMVTSTTLTISLAATGAGVAETLTVTNLPTAGIYPGAAITGTGIPASTLVESVTANTITMSAASTATATGESISVQNQISQPPEVLAAAHAGALMASAFPYTPRQGVTIGGLVPPQIASDRISIDPAGSSEAALTAGLSPLYVQAGGTVGFIRTRTTYALLPDNVTAVTSYFDWQDLVTLNDFREVCYQISQNPPFNNNPGGSKASAANAALFKDEVLREAQLFEDQGAFQGVKTLAPLFVVQPSVTSRGRFDFQIPVNVLPGLMVIAGNIQAQSALGNFTL